MPPSSLLGLLACGRRTKVKHLFFLLLIVLVLVLAAKWSEVIFVVVVEPAAPSNRTAEADNQRLLIFHRIPKTGSEMMQELGKVLGRLKGYRAFVDPWPPVYYPTEEQERKFANNFKRDILDKVGEEEGNNRVEERHQQQQQQLQ